MIVLVGFMGAGKSTIGRLVARELGLAFVDSDDTIEACQGRTIGEIFAADGEAVFRQREAEVIEGLLTGPTVVLSLGGGACESAHTRRQLAQHTVIYLRVSLAEALHRVGDDPGRPVLADPELGERYAHRQDGYAASASFVVDTHGRSPEELAQVIIGQLPTTVTGAQAARHD